MCRKFSREHSSVGLERLLDKQEVCGSNPHVPTKMITTATDSVRRFFCVSAYLQARLQRFRHKNRFTSLAGRLSCANADFSYRGCGAKRCLIFSGRPASASHFKSACSHQDTNDLRAQVVFLLPPPHRKQIPICTDSLPQSARRGGREPPGRNRWCSCSGTQQRPEEAFCRKIVPQCRRRPKG